MSCCTPGGSTIPRGLGGLGRCIIESTVGDTGGVAASGSLSAGGAVLVTLPGSQAGVAVAISSLVARRLGNACGVVGSCTVCLKAPCRVDL